MTTAKVETEDMVSKVTANGKIQAEKRVDLSALVMGQIIDLAVRNGNQCRKGDFLLQIDRNQAAAGEAGVSRRRESSLAASRTCRRRLPARARNWERAKKNYQAGILPEADSQKAKAMLETAEADFEAAVRHIEQNRANLNASRDTLSKTTVRAPIGGVVTDLPVKEGEVTVIGTMNNPGTQLMTISDMSSVEAVLMVDETDVPNVTVGQKALVSIEAYPDRAFEGLVTQVENSPIPKNDPELQGLITTWTRSISRCVSKHPSAGSDPPGLFDNRGCDHGIEALRPGRPATAARSSSEIRPRRRKRSGKDQDQSGVYVLQDGKAAFVPVRLGLAGELKVEVTSGIARGQEILTGPFKILRTLKDGSRVKVKGKEGRRGERVGGR